MSAATGTQRDICLDLTRILAFLAVPSVTDQLNYFPLTVGGTILVSLLLAAVAEGRVSLLIRLLRRPAKT